MVSRGFKLEKFKGPHVGNDNKAHSRPHSDLQPWLLPYLIRQQKKSKHDPIEVNMAIQDPNQVWCVWMQLVSLI